MSKSLFIFLLIAAAVGYYLYRTNRFTEVNASFDFSRESISVVAHDGDLHDCKLSLTHDYIVEIPLLRLNNRLTIRKYDFKQWNGTVLESITDLGPQVEFKLQCKEGRMKTVTPNRYEKPEKAKEEYRHEEVVERR